VKNGPITDQNIEFPLFLETSKVKEPYIRNKESRNVMAILIPLHNMITLHIARVSDQHRNYFVGNHIVPTNINHEENADTQTFSQGHAIIRIAKTAARSGALSLINIDPVQVDPQITPLLRLTSRYETFLRTAEH